MRIIPSAPSLDLTHTEEKVFRLVKQVEWGEGAVGLSSVNLSRHEHKRWGEVDFVLLGPRGLLAIEVKGGSVSCQSGVWRYVTKQGVVSRHESPFSQVAKSFFSLEQHLVGHDELELRKPIPGGFCVIFAGMRRKDLVGIIGGPEMPTELAGSAEDLESVGVFRKFLERVGGYWEQRGDGPRDSWQAARIRLVANFLRPEFERAVPLALRLKVAREERVRFTEEQYVLLDFLDVEPRLLVTGGAGSGKTFIAAEAARRESAAGSSVLFLTGTNALAGFLRDSSSIPGEVRVLSVREAEDAHLAGASADVVIVDEGQQVTSRRLTTLLDRVLRGGIENGRWRWFGDYARQVALDSELDPGILDLLKLLSTHHHLLHNCRNTPQLVTAAEAISGVRIGKALVRGAGPTLSWVAERRRDQVAAGAAVQLRNWLKSDISAEDIVLLFTDDGARQEAETAAKEAGVPVVLWGSAFKKRSRSRAAGLSSIRDFRGLESEYVQLFGLDDISEARELRALAYLGITRANFGASICGTKQLQVRLMGMVGIPGVGGGGGD